MNKELYRETMGQKIKEITLNKDEDRVSFIKSNDEKITLSDYHDQDCCERVYADFSAIKYYVGSIVGKKFKEMIIKGVEDIGFLICFYEDYEKGEKIFIPCYNEQNGYYSDQLELVVEGKNGKIKIDISDLVEDNID